MHAPENRHFYGHGQFSPDGAILYASENDFDGNRGVIGLYDARNGFARIGEYDAHGVGTHDMTVSDDGRLIVIANGGIETHPDFGRTKLNIDSMEPSLVLLDAATGQLIQKHVMPEQLRQLSTRHVDLGDNGRIWFACQYEGPRNNLPPLVGHFSKGEDVAFVDLPEETTVRLANYVGAIAVNRREGLVGLTSPSGNAAVTLDAKTGSVVSEVTVREAAGVATAAGGIAVSSYDGFSRLFAATWPGTSISYACPAKILKRQGTKAWPAHLRRHEEPCRVYYFCGCCCCHRGVDRRQQCAGRMVSIAAETILQSPNWIFGPVWTALYVLIGIAGARTWIRKPMGTRMRLWFTQMVLNFLWSPIFFGMQSPAGALVIIIPMLICIIAFMALTYRRDRISMWLFAPYALWVAFATVLNASIGMLN